VQYFLKPFLRSKFSYGTKDNELNFLEKFAQHTAAAVSAAADGIGIEKMNLKIS